MRWLRIAYPFSIITACFGLVMLFPAAVSFLMNDGMAWVYLVSGACIFALGGGAALAAKRFKSKIYTRDGFLLVCLIWTILPAYAAAPLLLALPQIGFVKAYFEAVSGLTASGGTVLSGLDALPPSVNFWRCEMSWLGGMGLILLATTISQLLGIGGSSILQTEMPGPMKDSRVTPRIRYTAIALWTIYSILTLLCAAAYYLAGMSLFDAVVHAFTTLGLGGFSSHDASYAYFNSPAIEAVAVVFMIIAGMNFAVHYSAWHKRSFRLYSGNKEWRAYWYLLLFAVLCVFAYLQAKQVYDSPLETFRYAVFNTVSIVTTTGYANTDFGAWPLFAPLLMLLFANFTSCSGSTGGGIKLIRALVFFKQIETEQTKLAHPAAFYLNKTSVLLPQKILVSIFFFILAYIVCALLFMLILIATGMDFLTAFSASVASISNTGPGLGEVGPGGNYGQLTSLQIMVCAAAMLIGRLELMTFLVIMYRNFWQY